MPGGQMSTNVPSSLEETEIFQNNDNLVDFFDNACQRHKDRIAFESFDVGMSYTQLSNQVNALALWLSKHFNVGDKVAVMMPNMLAYPVIVYGVLKAGMIVVNINPLYTKRELEHVLKDSEARLLLCWEGAAHVVASSDLGNVDQVVLTTVGDLLGFKGKIINFVVRKIKKLVPKFTLQNTLTFSQVLRENAKESFTNIELSHDQAAFLQYTGGTTGVSKGAILSHRNIMANTAQAYYVTNPKLYEDVDKDQTIAICPLPLYHIFALLAHNFLLFYFGAKNVLITNPRDLPTFVSILKKNKFHMISGVNTLFEALLNNEDFKKLDFSNLVTPLAGGMAALPSTAEKWHSVTNSVMLQAYGLTETSPLVSAMGYEEPTFTGSIGKPAPFTEVQIRNDDNQVISGVDEVGELCVRGPQVMRGYWKTEDSGIDENGWFKTGDIATIDASGHIFIVDRKKDMIIISGFNVYPNEVEAVVSEHPAVLECGCIGVEDEKSLETVKVFAVLHEGQSLTAEELIAFCRENLTAYKVPKLVEFIDELPKTNVGKVLRRELKNLNS
jgi:long-chain acyl-CoA synthetase